MELIGTDRIAINTYDNGVLHFVIGSRYSGETEHGGIDIIGALVIIDNDIYLKNHRGLNKVKERSLYYL